MSTQIQTNEIELRPKSPQTSSKLMMSPLTPKTPKTPLDGYTLKTPQGEETPKTPNEQTIGAATPHVQDLDLLIRKIDQ